MPKSKTEVSSITFFSIFRKIGFLRSLLLLSKKPILQHEFFNRLLNDKTYLNAFFRSKSDLLKYKLIEYGLDENNEMQISLTEKGSILKDKILEIEKLISSN